MKTPEILDLDLFIPAPRIIRLTEREAPQGPFARFWRAALRLLGRYPRARVREIDLSLVSTKATLLIERCFREFMRLSEDGKIDEAESAMYDLMMAAFQSRCPWMTRDWLLSNTVPDQILQIFQFIIEPLVERAVKQAEEMQALGKKKAAR
jgi:hypothetical protein